MADEKKEETALAVIQSESHELTPTAAAAEKQFEIQSAIAIARRFPRKEEDAYAKLMLAADRYMFADSASYEFPRGKVKNEETGRWVDNIVTGPSVYLAREAARIWGNIRYGIEVIRDDADSRQIRGFAWDLETNVKITAEDDFKKLKMKKKYDPKTREQIGVDWIVVDERDLRELTNRRGAILIRNCILQLIPQDYIDDVRDACDLTIEKGIREDIETAKKKIIVSFARISVTPDMLEAKLKHPLGESSPAEIADLRRIYKAIADGQAIWQEFIEKPKEENTAKIKLEDLKAGDTSGMKDPHDNDAAAIAAANAANQAQAGSDAPSHPAEAVTQSANNSAAAPATEKKTPPPPNAPAAASTKKNNGPKYSDKEASPFAPGGDLFVKK
jgi:hypothetical protein